MEEKAEMLAEMLKLLANKNRLLIFCALMPGPANVGELARLVPGIKQSALSQSLSLLKAHGLLSSEKQGQCVQYEIADRRVIEIISVLKRYYCD